MNKTILFFSYICRLYDLDLTTDVEITSVSGSHLPGKTNADVRGIHFLNGTMHSIPNGIGAFFENLIALVVGNGDDGPVSLRNIKRPNFENLSNLVLLSIYSNEIEEVDDDAFWDLPILKDFLLSADGSLTLHENFFQKNEELREVVLLRTQLEALPANLFNNNLLLEAVFISNCSIKSIDEGLFETNPNLAAVSLSSNKIEHLPKDLFKNNLWIEVIDFGENVLKTIDVDFTELHFIDYIDLEDNVCIDAYYEADSHRYDNSFTNLTELQSVIRANCSGQLSHYKHKHHMN